jgi:hypothetical protein
MTAPTAPTLHAKTREERRAFVARLLAELDGRVRALGNGGRAWLRRGALLWHHRPEAWWHINAAEAHVRGRAQGYIDGRAARAACVAAIDICIARWCDAAAIAAELERAGVWRPPCSVRPPSPSPSPAPGGAA